MTTECVFGLHAVQSLLEHAPQTVKELWVLDGRKDARMQKIVALAESNGVMQVVLSRKVLDERCNGNHQGVAAVAAPPKQYSEQDLQKIVEHQEKLLLLVLDGVTDPHNLGACLRSAEASGVHAVIVPKDNSCGINDVVRKVACGAAELVPFIQVTNLARTLRKLQDDGVWLVGTSGEASESIYQVEMEGSIAIVMGAEGKGMRRLTKETCDYLAYIPMAGRVTSLNVSVATGVCLFEVVRQRLAAPSSVEGKR